jgi:hypothetical protein
LARPTELAHPIFIQFRVHATTFHMPKGNNKHKYTLRHTSSAGKHTPDNASPSSKSKHRTPYKQYSTIDVQLALSAIASEHISIREAAKRFKVPFTTLKRERRRVRSVALVELVNVACPDHPNTDGTEAKQQLCHNPAE